MENAIVAARSKVRGAAAVHGDARVLSIADDGPGLAPAIAATAMDPSPRPSPTADGTGMGLPIARAAVSEEGGARRLGSASGGGLAVDFVVPICA